MTSSRLAKSSLIITCSIFLINCGIHPFDETQVPNITIVDKSVPTISWTPTNAYQLLIFEGKYKGDYRDTQKSIWAVRAKNYANEMSPPINYSEFNSNLNYLVQGRPVTSADDFLPLTVGKYYTVAINRKDPEGTGDGFSSTYKKYVGVKVFKLLLK